MNKSAPNATTSSWVNSTNVMTTENGSAVNVKNRFITRHHHMNTQLLDSFTFAIGSVVLEEHPMRLPG